MNKKKKKKKEAKEIDIDWQNREKKKTRDLMNLRCVKAKDHKVLMESGWRRYKMDVEVKFQSGKSDWRMK